MTTIQIRPILFILTVIIGLGMTACGSSTRPTATRVGSTSTPASVQSGSATLTPGRAGSTGIPASAEGGAYTNVTPAELTVMLESKDFLFVNVHIPYEGEIAQTDQFIAYEENGSQQIKAYPADKNAKIVLYCRSGRMSAIVAQELVKAGYTQVWNLDGGMLAWEEAGYRVIQK